MRTPCPFCGVITSACSCEENYVREEAEDIVVILRDMGYTVTPPGEGK